jgi:hypothetical protein
MKTKKDIIYRSSYFTCIIPEGTPIYHAINLPGQDESTPMIDRLYWSGKWQGMSEIVESWHRNYGLLLASNDVI